MRFRTTKSTPRGFTLIEMVLVIGGVTAVLGLAGGLIHMLLRLDRYSRDYLNDSMTVSKLSQQFRADVHRAAEASTTGRVPLAEGHVLLTMSADAKVLYGVQGPWLRREETAVGKPPRRESYRVDRLAPIVFESKGGFVSITAGRTPELSTTSFRSKIRIEARLGKTDRLGQLSEPKK